MFCRCLNLFLNLWLAVCLALYPSPLSLPLVPYLFSPGVYWVVLRDWMLFHWGVDRAPLMVTLLVCYTSSAM